ncbi:MAG: PD-(D/E)XK nuclease domain-containing protein [Candidatus Babeliales bacterium]
MQSSVSVKDFVTENSYHTFVLGLLCSMMQTHRIISNKETGAGFADILMIPEQGRMPENSPALLLEFKHIKLDERKTKKAARELSDEERLEKLKEGAEEGFAQAGTRSYAAELLNYHHVGRLITVGLAFLGKSSGAYYQETDMKSKQVQPKRAAFPMVDDLLEQTRASKKSRHAPTIFKKPASEVGSSSTVIKPEDHPSSKRPSSL